jgi:parvulin-like peptidyl-prolyl isomerase
MQFAERLPDVPVGQWTGPVESGYGLHLVLVHERSGGRTPPLDEVRDDVLRDWQLANREQTNREVYERFREKYDVVVERPEWAESDEMANAER